MKPKQRLRYRVFLAKPRRETIQQDFWAFSKAGRENDWADWAEESGKPRYILDLMLSVIHLSVQTVERLPRVKFEG